MTIKELLKFTVEMEASDLHISAGSFPMIRVHGQMKKINLPKSSEEEVRQLIYSVMNESQKALFEKNLEIDFSTKLSDNTRFRVNAFHQINGLAVAFRVIPNEIKNFDELHLPVSLSKLAMKEKGLILVTGPTGSGKSTTLHAALKTIKNVETNIVTVEDPVEYRLDGITQIETNEKIGLTFSRALRSVLRQDPDIVLIGEIRDEETADISIKFSLTGHLVFTTLHANDSAATITRLIDIGIPPYLVASSLNLVMAQRLMRKICPHCKTDYSPTEKELREAGITDEEAKNIDFKIGTGCVHCDNTGYIGRSGIFEMLEITSEIRKLIFEGKNQEYIREAARKNGMKTLHDSAMIKMREGITTIKEVIKLTVID